MDTREWFNESTYSDLTIKLSDGTEISVHKAIVCRANSYFSKLCGPGSYFAESKQNIIELKDDDPKALTMVLRHIYDLPIVPDPADDWRAWLDIRVAADKYLDPKLSKVADAKYREAALACTDIDGIFDIIDTILTDMNHDESLVAFSESIRKDNLGKLLKNARFREHLDASGKVALWAQLDELAFAADLSANKYVLCEAHRDEVFKIPPYMGWQHTCTLCPHNPYRSNTVYSERVAWLSK